MGYDPFLHKLARASSCIPRQQQKLKGSINKQQLPKVAQGKGGKNHSWQVCPCLHGFSESLFWCCDLVCNLFNRPIALLLCGVCARAMLARV